MELAVAEAHFRAFYLENHEVLAVALQKMINSLKNVLDSQDTYKVAALTGRVKDMEGSVEKLSRKYMNRLVSCHDGEDVVNLITDLVGLRIVCYYEDHIVPLSDLVGLHYDVVSRTDKIVEATDSGTFGYRALHLDLQLDPTRASLVDFSELAGLTFEVQIRSIVQDAWSTLDHSIKYKRNLPVPLARRVVRLAALAELMDSEFIHIREGVTAAETDAVVLTDDAITDVVSFARLAQRSRIASRIPPHRLDAMFDDVIRAGLKISRAVLDRVVADEGLLEQFASGAQRAGLNLQDSVLMRGALWWADPRYSFLLDAALRQRLEDAHLARPDHS